MLPLITAATARELIAALPHRTDITVVADTGLATTVCQRDTAALTGAAVHAQQLREHCAYAVHLAGQPWLACITGVGPINAALAMGLTFARVPSISAVLNVGLAGTFDLTRAPLGSTIAVTQEIWPEYGLADDTGVDAAGLGFPLWAKEGIIDRLPLSADPVPMGLPPLPLVPAGPSAQPNIDAAGRTERGIDSVSPKPATNAVDTDAIGAGAMSTNALPLIATAAVTQGTALTVAGVTNSMARAQRLQHRYAALIENMEGFAVALACARHKVPLLELRTISNVTGSRLARDRDFPLAFRNMNLFFTTYFTHTQ